MRHSTLTEAFLFEKKKSNRDARGNKYVSLTPEQRLRFGGVTVKQDADGYYVCTHRARSKSYPSPEAIPDSKIKFVSSTG